MNRFLSNRYRLLAHFRKKPLKWLPLVTLLFVSATTLLRMVSVTRRSYPYSTYTGLPLPIYDHPYLIKPKILSSSEHSINLIIVIHSKVTNFIKRKTIRNTWAKEVLLSRFGFKVVFFLGKPYNEDIQNLVYEESSKFGDIVQGTFHDHYLNISHKAVLVYRWLTEHCRETPFVLKLDDDVFVNIFRLYHDFLPSLSAINKTMWCEIKPPFSQKIHRWKGQRHKIADHEFTGYSHYPIPFCRGYFVLMSKDSVSEIYDAAKEAPFFWIDDIYVYGILVQKTGVKLTQTIRYLNSVSEKRALTCFGSRNEVCPLLGVLVSSTSVMETLWTLSVDQINWHYGRFNSRLK